MIPQVIIQNLLGDASRYHQEIKRLNGSYEAIIHDLILHLFKHVTVYSFAYCRESASLHILCNGKMKIPKPAGNLQEKCQVCKKSGNSRYAFSFKI